MKLNKKKHRQKFSTPIPPREKTHRARVTRPSGSSSSKVVAWKRISLMPSVLRFIIIALYERKLCNVCLVICSLYIKSFHIWLRKEETQRKRWRKNKGRRGRKIRGKIWREIISIQEKLFINHLKLKIVNKILHSPLKYTVI